MTQRISLCYTKTSELLEEHRRCKLARHIECWLQLMDSALNSLHWLPIQQRINFNLATLVHRSLHNAGPQYLSSLLHPYTPFRQLRSESLNLLSQPRINIALASRGFRHAGPSLWNSLPHHVNFCLR